MQPESVAAPAHGKERTLAPFRFETDARRAASCRRDSAISHAPQGGNPGKGVKDG
jgi:hypothetical protein